MVVEGVVWSQVSQEDAYAEFRAITSPMVETLDVGPALLKWTEGASGLSLQRLVKLAGDVDPPIEGGEASLSYQAQFYAEDPRAYAQIPTLVVGGTLSAAAGGMVLPVKFPFTFSPSAGGTAPVSNVGNRPTPPAFRIYGQCTNPQILLVETGERIVLSGTVAAGDFLEIDTQRRSVSLNGLTSRNNFIVPATTEWFELPKGGSTIRLLAETFDATARVDVEYRAAYS